MKKISGLAKKVDAVMRFFKGLTIAGGIGCFILLAMSWSDGFYEDLDFVMNLDILKIQLSAAYVPGVETLRFYFWGMCIMGILLCVWMYCLIAMFRKIIKPMREELPFAGCVAGNIRKLSWIMLIGEGILSVVYFVFQIWEYHAFDYENLFLSDKIVSVGAEYYFDFTFVWIFLVLYLLSYVFQYGQELQIQSDETL